MPPAIAPRPFVGYAFLNLAWILSLIVVLVILAISTVGMFAMMPAIGEGIGSIRGGLTADSGFEAPSAWTFNWSTPIGATGSVQSSGGNPDGYGEVQLAGRPQSLVGGYWWQAFVADGSHPFLAGVRLDYRVFQTSTILSNLTIAVFVQSIPGNVSADLSGNVWSVTTTQAANWTPATAVYAPTGETVAFVDVSSKVPRSGTYYLKVAVQALNRPGGPGTPTIVGIDNVRLIWRTNAFIDVYVIAPVPILLALTQAPTAFYIWTAAVVAVTVACLVVLALRDRRKLWDALRTSSEHMPAKLRSRSATVAIMQTFLAVTFLSVIVAVTTQAPEPSFFETVPEWYLLFSLVNAPVYEEIVFRVLMIGLPLMAGSLFFRSRAVVRGRVPTGTTTGRYLAGSLRYLVGGGMSRSSSRRVLLPAFLFLATSSTVFGLAHVSGYGDYKVLPAAVAGLAMGYLFLRHGLHAAVLFHFATDVLIATSIFVGSNSPLGLAINPFGILALTIPGAGFFTYYVLYVFRLGQDVLRPHPARIPAGPGGSYMGGGPPAYAPAGPYPQGTAWTPASPAAPPPPVPVSYVPATRPPGYGTSPVEYRCPRCAWVEAAYENGRFRCLRCGYVT